MRYAVLFLLCLSACSSSYAEQRQQLASYQRNAKYYYDGGNYGQALGQIERGLQIEADDYMLRALRGAILLKASESAIGTDHKVLDEATEELAGLFEERAATRHEPYLLVSYALARQKQGRRHLGEAIRLRDQATRAPDAASIEKKAEAEQKLAIEELRAARDLLAVLEGRGEMLRIAHYHQFQIAVDLGDHEASDKHAKAYLVQVKKEEDYLKAEIDRTPNLDWERAKQADLRQLRNEELLARNVLAQTYFTRGKFEDALAMLDRVLELDPQRSIDYYNRGRVLLELQQTERAKADFRKFLATTSLPPSNEKTALALRALDR